MNLSFDSSITAKIVKAAAEYDLIEDGDKIAVGLSGGKDSTFLLMILKIFKLHFEKDFQLRAVHVDPGFNNNDNNDYFKKLCSELDLELKIIKTDIAKYIENEENKNPCSKCAHFRKGAIIDYLKKEKYNKIAFGHHLDDVVETYLMSIFYSGQLKTLQPKRFLTKSKIDIIRPLIYLREKIIIEEINKRSITPLKSCCPYDGNSGRSKIRNQFNQFFKNEQLFANIVSAMRNKDNKELWPAEMDYLKLKKKMKNYWS